MLPIAPLQHTTSNGVDVLLAPRKSLAMAFVHCSFQVGSRNESVATNGITHVLEHMLFRGTPSFASATILNHHVENYGGYLDGATYRDHVTFSAGVAPSGISSVLSALAEMVQAPTYAQLEIERDILREELLESLDYDGQMIELDNITHRNLFGKQGLGFSIEGSLSNVDGFSAKDLESYRQQSFTGDNLIITVVGNFDTDKISAQIDREFSTLPAHSTIHRRKQFPRSGHFVYQRSQSSQVDLRVSFPCAAIHSDNYPALMMLSRVLGDGMASRIYSDLVDNQGLAYSLHAGITHYTECGLFDIELSVAPDRGVEALSALLNFTKQARRLRYTDEEIAYSCQRYGFAMAFAEDSAADLAGWYSGCKMFKMEPMLKHLPTRLASLTPQNLRTQAQQLFTSNNISVSAVGGLARGQLKTMKQLFADY